MRAERLSLASGEPTPVHELAQRIRALASAPPELGDEVRGILAAVFHRGDAAVTEFTRRFDSPNAVEELRVPPARLQQTLKELDPSVRAGLELAAANVRAVCEAEPPGDVSVQLPQGQTVQLKEVPVGRAGVYVPGGRAAYPSSVVMCCVPAKVAGVGRIAVATPPGPNGEPDQTVLAACALCEVDEVYLMGGAQAIAALAFGTDTVDPVDVIAGPGSYYVQEAKRQVTGVVRIDAVAGPSELVVIADAEADPRLVALDLAAQSEHGSESLLVLLTPSASLIETVQSLLDELSASRPSTSDAPVALVEVPGLEAAVGLADEIAPEHLELICDGARDLAGAVKAAGCVFVGPGAATAFGDYVAGSNHVLPTGGAARFSGPLGAATFRRRQALVSLPQSAVSALAPHASSVARAEGFPVHAESVEARVDPQSTEG